MKIESWVPQAMDNPMLPTFGRIDALRESSVETTKSPISPNTMKIESWVPQAMDYPMPPTFGRIDALRESSVEITKITDSTKRHENRCVGAPGHGRTDCTHVWSLRCTGIDFGSSLYA